VYNAHAKMIFYVVVIPVTEEFSNFFREKAGYLVLIIAECQ
jgi:hypothetical protein